MTLDYTYGSNDKSNQLQSVTDGGTNDGYFAVAGNYGYDANGNMTSDPSKGTGVEFNYLNLPERVTFGGDGEVRYTYDAAGNKLRKVVDVSGTTGNSEYNYSGNFLYENNDLKAIFTSEGRIIPFDNNGEVVYKFEYSLKDHLGNSRVVFSGHSNGMAEVMQVTEYYPFGLVMNQQNYFADGVLSNKYLYNGKELQDDELAGNSLGWYDYGARFYDAELGRWHSVDPLAEDYHSLSSYSYVANNPMIYIDPDGMRIDGYTIDEFGYIKRVDNTGGENYDVLFSKHDYEIAKQTGVVNKYGNPEPKNQAKITDTSILSKLKNIGSNNASQATRSIDGYDMLEIFKFAADNSNVEWSLDKYNSERGEMYTISTFHHEDVSPGHETLGISTESMISSWHSHPDVGLNWERSSMGDLKYGTTTSGKSDWQRTIDNYTNYGRETYKNNVYFPRSGNRYYISPWKIINLNAK